MLKDKGCDKMWHNFDTLNNISRKKEISMYICITHTFIRWSAAYDKNTNKEHFLKNNMGSCSMVAKNRTPTNTHGLANKTMQHYKSLRNGKGYYHIKYVSCTAWALGHCKFWWSDTSSHVDQRDLQLIDRRIMFSVRWQINETHWPNNPAEQKSIVPTRHVKNYK